MTITTQKYNKKQKLMSTISKEKKTSRWPHTRHFFYTSYINLCKDKHVSQIRCKETIILAPKIFERKLSIINPKWKKVEAINNTPLKKTVQIIEHIQGLA